MEVEKTTLFFCLINYFIQERIDHKGTTRYVKQHAEL